MLPENYTTEIVEDEDRVSRGGTTSTSGQASHSRLCYTLRTTETKETITTTESVGVAPNGA